MVWLPQETRALRWCLGMGLVYAFLQGVLYAGLGTLKTGWSIFSLLTAAVGLDAALVAIRRPWSRFVVLPVFVATVVAISALMFDSGGCLSIPIALGLLAPLLVAHVQSARAVIERAPRPESTSIVESRQS